MTRLTAPITSQPDRRTTAQQLSPDRVLDRQRASDQGASTSNQQSDSSSNSNQSGFGGTHAQLREQQTGLNRIQAEPTTAEKLSVPSYSAHGTVMAYQPSRQQTALPTLGGFDPGFNRNASNGAQAGTTYIAQSNSQSNNVVATDRREQIDGWVEQNANAKDTKRFWFDDDKGGERVADAYNGQSSLGDLSTAEVHYLAEQSLNTWQNSGNGENLRESTVGIESAQTRAVVADAYAQPSVNRFATAKTQGEAPAELSQIHDEALHFAIELDAPAVIAAHEGHEGALGSHVNNGLSYKHLLNAVGDKKVDVTSDGVSKMVTAIVLKTPPEAYYFQNGFTTAASNALAAITVNPSDYAGLPSSFYHQQVSTVSARFEGVLLDPNGAQLIASDRVAPELRGWAITQIAQESSWNINNLGQGWESELVSQSFSQPIMEQYQGRGMEPQELSGEALRNTIGQALGIAPDRLPGDAESAVDRQTRLDAGLDHQYYEPNKTIDDMVEKLTGLSDGSIRNDAGRTDLEISNTIVTLSIMPVVVTSNDFGAANFNVFKVEASDASTHFVENINSSRSYDSVSDWKSNSQLPPGKMTYAQGLDWQGGSAQIVTENTAKVRDSFGEWARTIGDGAAIVVGVGAGIAIVVGSGGTALIIGAGVGAGAYTTARAGEQLHDAHTHGEDISNLSDAKIRGLWIDAAAGTLSFGAMAATRSATKLATAGSRLAPAAMNSAAGVQLAANSADVISGSNQAIELGKNWDKLSSGQRAAGLLSVAFWGGTTVAGSRVNGGALSDDFSFMRLRNNIEFGTPFPQETNFSLQTGEIRVAYANGVDGRATDIRIQHGPGPRNESLLNLHVQAARQMDASGGMRDRLGALLGQQKFEVGSAAWEARIEIRKIEGEQKTLVNDLSTGTLTGDQQTVLQLRLNELDDALLAQSARLEYMENRGEGWVASPSTGTQQAAKLGFDDAPNGHIWVHGGANDPHLRRMDGSVEKYYFDKATNGFKTTLEDRPMERVGREGAENDFKWEQNGNGETIRVTGTLREFFRFATRSGDELKAQAQTRASGIEGDHAGHILGHRFVLDQGLQNMFPQDANLNTSAYKTLENELADWVSVGAEVDISINLLRGSHGRPDMITVEYTAVRIGDDGASYAVYKNRDAFDNSGGQIFDRLDAGEMQSRMDAGGTLINSGG